jgi:hypothetical protein
MKRWTGTDWAPAVDILFSPERAKRFAERMAEPPVVSRDLVAKRFRRGSGTDASSVVEPSPLRVHFSFPQVVVEISKQLK